MGARGRWPPPLALTDLSWKSGDRVSALTPVLTCASADVRSPQSPPRSPHPLGEETGEQVRWLFGLRLHRPFPFPGSWVWTWDRKATPYAEPLHLW